MAEKPITPHQAGKRKNSPLPDEVIRAFNELIERNFDGLSADVQQDHIVEILVSRGFDRKKIFEDRLLNVEPLYEKAGWRVHYDKPGYTETYSAHFTFTAKD